MNAKEIIMKHKNVVGNSVDNFAANAFAIAAVAALVLGMAPTAKADNKGCSNASLTGTFAYTLTETVIAPPAIAGPAAEVGIQTFDGKGGTTATATLSANGTIVQLAIAGTYTVNPDCTGTFTLQIAQFGITQHVFFVLDDSVAEFRAIETDAGFVGTRVGRRQFPAGDWRQ
jgi:hypothetical protein